MKLSAKDFTGDGARDFRFGFIMPKKCLYEDDCMWICENMIRPWGISNRTIESDQNLNISDVEKYDDHFVTPIIQTEDDDLPPEDRRRMLSKTAASTNEVHFSDTGYLADDDVFEMGLLVDDPVFGEALNVDPSDGDKLDWLLIALGGGGVAIILAVVLIFVCKKGGKSGSKDEEEHLMQKNSELI